MTKPITRNQIIEAADMLFYQQGYEYTSFANLSDAVYISRGNVYHHFKTKDEILNAVIEKRLADTQAMLDQWEKGTDSPLERIQCYIQILNTNWDKIHHYGCPVGTLCTELAKLNHASKDEARAIFTLFHTWLKEQFSALGKTDNADDLAMHVIAWSQGAATMASTFQDKAFIEKEIERITSWLEGQCYTP